MKRTAVRPLRRRDKTHRVRRGLVVWESLDAFIGHITRPDGRELVLFVTSSEMMGRIPPDGKDIFCVGIIEGNARVPHKHGESPREFAERAIEDHSHTFLDPKPTLKQAIRDAERYAKTWMRSGAKAAACSCGPIAMPRNGVSQATMLRSPAVRVATDPIHFSKRKDGRVVARAARA